MGFSRVASKQAYASWEKLRNRGCQKPVPPPVQIQSVLIIKTQQLFFPQLGDRLLIFRLVGPMF
jgi:hypothetical protein